MNRQRCVRVCYTFFYTTSSSIKPIISHSSRIEENIYLVVTSYCTDPDNDYIRLISRFYLFRNEFIVQIVITNVIRITIKGSVSNGNFFRAIYFVYVYPYMLPKIERIIAATSNCKCQFIFRMHDINIKRSLFYSLRDAHIKSIIASSISIRRLTGDGEGGVDSVSNGRLGGFGAAGGRINGGVELLICIQHALVAAGDKLAHLFAQHSLTDALDGCRHFAHDLIKTCHILLLYCADALLVVGIGLPLR